ncbi:cellulase family glycosylhydrolase [Mycolicibacterium llatzerense]|uniref:cellulase family glycosylhydrolase n=1 Tax=Mycolicibacterium llatzerense TaxID=280871 RepID=UPI0008DE3B2E|nr:cellulase family glycosylhydrolase [Mycolicibacterium llatzerense]
MYSSLRGSLRACTFRGVVAILPVAMICAYAPPSELPSRLVTAQVENTAEIVSSPSSIGIADSGLYGETQAQINQTLDTLQSIGVQDVRVFVPWIYVEPGNGVYNWSSIDMVIQAAQARNMGVMAELASTPLWAAPSGTIPGAGTPDPATFASFATAVAQRYGTAISAYEIWNEPNYALSSDPIDPVAYAALLKAAYPAIKAVDPSATIVAGALGSVISFGGVTMDPVTFVKQMLAAGAANYFDALSFHPYQESLPFSSGLGVANSPLSQLNSIYQLMTQYGDGLKKIWISEFGASTNDVGQQTQADLIKNLIDTWQTIAYAGPVFIYTAQDGVPGADGYGIYNADWTPKLAVAVIQQAIAKYSSGLLGGVGTVVGGVTSGVAAVAQSLANLLQSIGQAIQGEFQQLGKAINAWAAAVSAKLSGTLPTASPLAAKVAAVKTTAVTTTAEASTGTASTGASTGTTLKATTVQKRAKSTSGGSGSTSSTTPASTTASSTDKASDPDAGAAADSSGKSRDKSKSHKGDGSTSHLKGAHGTAVTSGTSADETSGTTPVVVDKRSHHHSDTSSSSTSSASDH